MTETIFSHRSDAGVSVGARNVNGSLYVAFAFVNDGTSRNGVFWRERHDNFCRATARQIIDGRISAAIQKSIENQMVMCFSTNERARDFMGRFRKGFLDDENLFVDTLEFDDGIEVKVRPLVNKSMERLKTLITEVATNASISV